MKQKSPFRLLLGMFQDRFFENDTISPGGGFETNIYQVLGFLVGVGFFVAYLTMPAFLELSFQKPSPASDWALRQFRLFYPAASFAVIGFVTVFEWDMLFPDRRDFLILTQFPVSMYKVLAAKFGALGLFLLLLIAALNFFPTLMITLFCLGKPQAYGFGMKMVLAQTAAIVGASCFAFFAVAALQGLLINITSPRIFRRLSPSIQMFGMSLMVFAILTFPIYVSLLPLAVAKQQSWLWILPPVWFIGFYDLMLPRPDAFFAGMGSYALKMSGLAMLGFCLTWALGFRGHYRRTLEAEFTGERTPSADRLRRWTRSPQEWAILAFSGKTLARSTKHRLFLATYTSVGLAIGLLIAMRAGPAGVTLLPEGLRAFPFLIAFFVVSGFRTVFQFPADLACNWLLQMTEDHWTETSRRAARKRVLVSGLMPVLLLAAPLEIATAGWRLGMIHLVFQLMAGAILIEVMFWTFDKVPFTCSYFAGKISLSILAGLYLYGFTTYSFNMADFETALDSRGLPAILFFAAAAVVLALSWRRAPAPSEVRFDGSEPLIQTLDLT